ncbi:MAG: hypothetical protein HOC74_12095 [Gemmatimonadetes bacterium]|jgi:hypothetical protein|nr:hypothetical protein [Gemmatimonadota bacterium]
MLVISAEKSLPIEISLEGRERRDRREAGICLPGYTFLERGLFLMEIFVFAADKSYSSLQIILECQCRS